MYWFQKFILVCNFIFSIKFVFAAVGMSLKTECFLVIIGQVMVGLSNDTVFYPRLSRLLFAFSQMKWQQLLYFKWRPVT